MKAIWEGVVLAESDDCVEVESSQYFPSDSIKREHFKESQKRTVCPRKGVAHYFHIEVNGRTNQDAAWYYPRPRPAARHVKDRVAFWKGVRVEK